MHARWQRGWAATSARVLAGASLRAALGHPILGTVAWVPSFSPHISSENKVMFTPLRT